MTDLHELLRAAGAAPAGDAPAGVVDADVARGRRALRRRRRARRRSGTAAALLLVAAAFITSVSSVPRAPDIGAAPPTTRAPDPARAPIRLTAYSGTQPAGYTVDRVPSGWEIQGVDDDALTIAPVGFADSDVTSFRGKLVVMLASRDETGVPTGRRVQVGGVAGVVNRDSADPAVLSYTDEEGHRVVVNVPASLRWDDDEIAAFGAAVHVSPSAAPGRG